MLKVQPCRNLAVRVICKRQYEVKTKQVQQGYNAPRKFGTVGKGVLGVSVLGFAIAGLENFLNPNLIQGLLTKDIIDVVDRVNIRTNGGSFISYAGLLAILYLLKQKEEQLTENTRKNKDDIIQNFKFQILISSGLIITSIVLAPIAITFKSLDYITNDLFFSSIFSCSILFFCGFYEIFKGEKRAKELNIPWGFDATIQNFKQQISNLNLLNNPPYETAIAFSAWEGLIVNSSLILAPFSPFTGYFTNNESDFLRRFCPTGSLAYIIVALCALTLSKQQQKNCDEFRWFNFVLFLANFFIVVPTFLGQQEGVDFIVPNFSVVFVGIPQSLIPLYAALTSKSAEESTK